MLDPIIITVAPNGARKTTSDLAQIPVTTQAIAEEAENCTNAGTSVMHLHIRDEREGHTLDVNQYKETIVMIKGRVGDNMIVQATTEAVGIYKPSQQIDVALALKPESLSLAIREFVPTPEHETAFQEMVHELHQAGTVPQYILYSPDEVAYFVDMKKRGIIPAGKSWVLFVLGKKQAVVTGGSAAAQPEDLDPFLEMFDKGLNLSETVWSVCAFGENELACMIYAVKCGGNPRIGFENNHLMADGEIAPSNAALIQQFADAVQSSNRKIATAKETFELISID